MTHIVNTLLRKTGLEVHRLQGGRDSFRDAQSLLGLSADLVVFDIGANDGQSIKRIRETFHNAKIHAFEPSPSSFEKLRATTPGDQLLELSNLALGSKQTTLKFFENSLSDMSSFLSPSKDHWGEIEDVRTVQVETIDRYCHQHSIRKIDLLKIDTQGYDLEVLRGAEHMLSENLIKSVLIELTFIEIFQGALRFDEVISFLLNRNFRLISLYDVVFRRDAIAWADGLFVRRTPDLYENIH
jgi:FkbM family methyltransferase